MSFHWIVPPSHSQNRKERQKFTKWWFLRFKELVGNEMPKLPRELSALAESTALDFSRNLTKAAICKCSKNHLLHMSHSRCASQSHAALVHHHLAAYWLRIRVRNIQTSVFSSGSHRAVMNTLGNEILEKALRCLHELQFLPASAIG